MPDYLDPHVIGRVKGYELRSLRLVESYMAGMHKSKLLGISTEFAQHRQYVPGDDTKHLDWKVFARTDRYFVKQYEAETNMEVFFLLDASNSMFYKSDAAAMTKFDYAATVVATLAFLLMQQKDSFGLVLFDEQARQMMTAKGSHSHFRNCLDMIEKAEPGHQTDISNCLFNIAPQLRRRSLVVVVSDFVDQTEQLAHGVGQMSFGNHDMVMFHIEDPAERDFPFRGQTIFLGTENEGKLLCEPRDLRRAYLNARKQHLATVQGTAMRFGYNLEYVATDRRLDETLSKFLAMRLERRKRR